MKYYQDTETGQVFGFEDFEDPFTIENRNIPKTLRAEVIDKPSNNHVWYHGDWVSQDSVLIGYTSPISSVPIFCPVWTMFMFSPGNVIIGSSNDKLEISLEQINTNTYDGRYFSKIISHIAILDSAQPVLITRDGAVIIPRNNLFSSQDKAINLINKIAGALFIGGVIVPAADYASLEAGTLLDDGKNVFSHKPSWHSNIRNNWCSMVDRGILLHIRYLEINKLHSAYKFGNKILRIIPELTPEFLVRGYSSLQNKNLTDALFNLWVIVEQLTRHICEKSDIPVKTQNKNSGEYYSIPINKLLKTLKYRKILCDDTFIVLDNARNTRNAMMHKGKSAVEFIVVEDLWVCLFKLFNVATNLDLNGLINSTVYDNNGRMCLFQKHGIIEQDLNNVNFDEWLNYQKAQL